MRQLLRSVRIAKCQGQLCLQIPVCHSIRNLHTKVDVVERQLFSQRQSFGIALLRQQQAQSCAAKYPLALGSGGPGGGQHFLGVIEEAIGFSKSAKPDEYVCLIYQYAAYAPGASPIRQALTQTKQGLESLFDSAIVGGVWAKSAENHPLIGGFLATFGALQCISCPRGVQLPAIA
jgi:hypothetical protein